MTSLKFRFHRGGLDESMETTIDVNGWGELITHIEMHWGLPVTSIYVKHYKYDSRIHWDTHIVSTEIGGDKFPIGFLNGSPKDAWDACIPK